MAGAVEKSQRVVGYQCDIAPAPDFGAVEAQRGFRPNPALIRQVDEHLRGCLPEGVPPSYRDIVDARSKGSGKAKTICANLVMFDGEPAQIVLTEHKPKRDAAGPFAVPIWSHRWVMDQAVFWEDGAWHRDDADEFGGSRPQMGGAA